MFKLILKDFQITKKISAIFAIYLTFVSFMVCKAPSPVNKLFQVVSIFISIYIVTLYANGYDGKYKINVSFNSMPIKKVNIVLAKYLFVLVCSITYFFISFIFTKLFSVMLNIGTSVISLSDFAVVFIMVSIFYSIYYPLYYKFEGEKFKIITSSMYAIVILMPTFLAKLMKTEFWENIKNTFLSIKNINVIYILVALIVSTIIVISISTSINLYYKKEFN